MKEAVRIIAVAGALLLAGCGPKEPPAPAVPEKSVAEQRREDYFGAAITADKSIAWRPSNLGIKILAPGEGALVQLSDRVRVHYTGRLKDGTVFDDSRARGQPAEFNVNALIAGWSAGMLALRPGGRAVFYIPPHLGYGGLRAGKVPPFSGLIFEVEVLAVNPPVATKP
ncbi:MAG: FKBP-type peptidyl-prolyl cis-trans isomerase [Opitutae bacterium]|nr:FKBP-type peptidyl-prolyl cis-trans isomerase [Opitutae bacterium]